MLALDSVRSCDCRDVRHLRFLAGLNDRQGTRLAGDFGADDHRRHSGANTDGLHERGLLRKEPSAWAIFAIITGFVGGITNIGTYAALSKAGRSTSLCR